MSGGADEYRKDGEPATIDLARARKFAQMYAPTADDHAVDQLAKMLAHVYNEGWADARCADRDDGRST